MNVQTKKQIAKKFSKAASYYNKIDHFQCHVANQLINYLPNYANFILDLGCGTGKWTQRLANIYTKAHILGIDFAQGMLQQATENIRTERISWCTADIEALPCHDNSVDLIFSNLAIQWCGHLRQVISEIARVLKPKGVLVFSTLSRGTLIEVSNIWQKIDSWSHINEYPDFAEQKNTYLEFLPNIKYLKCNKEIVFYQTVMQFIHEFKYLGINTIITNQERKITTSSRLKQFIIGYERLRNKHGLPCTYNVIYGTLIKK